jgi:hypothetical protein
MRKMKMTKKRTGIQIIEAYNELQEELTSSQTNYDRAVGALEEAMKNLKEQQINSIKEGKKILEKRREKEVQLEENLRKDLEVFKDRWGDKIDDQ